MNQKYVLITGASRGIGRACALAFARNHFHVFLNCRHSLDALQQVEKEILDEHGSCTLLPGNAGNPDDVRKMFAIIESICPGLDVLVNGAGVLRLGPTETLSDDDWHDCMTVNASGVFYLLRALVPHFKGQRRGAIVTIGSNAAHVPRMQMAAYCASKAAVTSLTQTVGLELAPFGVRANLVSPGSTDTPMLRGMLPNEEAMARTIAGLPEQFKLGIPLRKVATPAEIAHTVLFLASDLASHITLQDLVVDGGATLSA